MQFSIFSVADHYPEELRTIRELYTQILDEIELADELCFSAFFLAEHHFHKYGLVPSPLHTYVSESPGSARAEAEEALKRYVRSRLYAKWRSYDELETAGLILFGDAEQVSSRIRELEAAGMNHLMILPDFGALQAERVRASLKRFAREVMPNFVESGSISAS